MDYTTEAVSFQHEENSSASSLSVSAEAGRHHENHKSGDSSPKASMDDALKSEAAFIDFVMSLPDELHCSEDSVSSSSYCKRAAGPKSQPTSSKVGLDHLDNLCRLMEQLGELRDNNNKLQKRVQYLEDLRTLHDMHKEIREGMDPEEETPPFRLQKSFTETRCTQGPPSRTPSKHRRSTTSSCRRERSKSVGHEEGEDPKSKSIFPKWSKVKEAFGWESERKDSVKVKGECERQSVRRCSDESKSSTRRGCDDGSSLMQSSTEEVHALIQRCAADGWRQGSCEKRLSLLVAPSDGLRRQKSTPSPGSDRSPYRHNDSKTKSSTIDRDSCIDPSYTRYEKDEAKRGKSPWGRVKTIIERRRDSLKRRHLRRDPEKSLEILDPLEIGGVSADEVDKGLAKDQEGTPGSSPPFHRKSRWTRVKKALRGRREDEASSQSTPASPGVAAREGNFNFDALEEISQDSSEGPRTEGPVRVGSEGQVHRLAVPNRALMIELERNLSDDFHRKIREWERMKKKPHDHKNLPVKPKLKDLAWLDKELRKIEKEKQRLSKERSKYEERAFRLEKLRETVLSARSSTKKEVLVRTSAGEFRFEGISDAFTKKLYEWETKRGVGPELSTIALLDSSRLTEQRQPKLSRSESSLAEVGQHSHNSSNSLPSLMPHEDADRLNQHSRANSEPDLSTLVAFANGANMKGSLESLGCAEEVCKSDPEEEEDEVQGRKRKDSEKYYGLLEENVILLEQLKDKEELCRRLEKELETLDEKVEDMGARHSQQMERYREKLWEMHKPGTSPTAVQGCLATMAQLRKRIETLERCTEKLRNDRESIEDSFRYHSKQQEHMTLDLLEKMRELQAAGNNSEASENQAMERHKSRSNLDSSAVERLQDLSALLVKQTEELEATLSAKTRQICELRWELLHRDLSTVRLETELHKRTAHSKRNKYAHYRSLSSEEASSTHLPNSVTDHNKQKHRNESLVGCSEKDLFNNEEENFQATQLSNTVHQLNRELLRLSSVNDNVPEEKLETEWNDNTLQFEESNTQQMDNEIRVRRSSADNINTKWAPTDKAQSSSDNDSSEEESFTRVSWCSGNRRTEDTTMVLVRNREERLLMSPGEQHPSTRIHRRKRVTRNSSGRKRFNAEPLPQKCHSFREVRERIVDDSRSISSDSKLNLRCENHSENAIDHVTKTASESWTGTGDDRVKLFDSKPSPEIIEKLMKDRQRREVARREHLQRKRSRRWMKSPPLKSEETQCAGQSDEVSPTRQPEKTPLTRQPEESTHMRECEDTPTKRTSEKTYIIRQSEAANLKKHNEETPIIRQSEVTHLTRHHEGTPIVWQSEVTHITKHPEETPIVSSETTHLTGHHEGTPATRQSEVLHLTRHHEETPIVSSSEVTPITKHHEETPIASQSEVANLARHHEEIPLTRQLKQENSTIQYKETGEEIPLEEIPILWQSEVTHLTKHYNETSLIRQSEETTPTTQCNEMQESVETPTRWQSEKRSKEWQSKIPRLTKQSEEIHSKRQFKETPLTREPEETSAIKSREGTSPSLQSAEFHDQSSLERNETDETNVTPITDDVVPASTVTVLLPKRKFSADITEDKTESVETVTIVMPRKRSLSSENECRNSDSVDRATQYNQPEDDHQNLESQQESRKSAIIEKKEASTQISITDPLVNHLDAVPETSAGFANYQLSRKPRVNYRNLQITEGSVEVPSITINEVEKSRTMVQFPSITNSASAEDSKSNYCYKSPSAPQLDWMKSCAKKTVRDGAPNVKVLIERYNQRAIGSPSGSNMSSPVTPRKTNIPQCSCSTPTTPNLATSTFYSPLMFRPSNLDLYPASPPPSPASRARAEALQRAKEKFIASPPQASPILPRRDSRHAIRPGMRRVVPSDAKRIEVSQQVTKPGETGPTTGKIPEEDRVSMDSMSLMVLRTGANCQESRRHNKRDQQQREAKEEEYELKTSKSLSSSSLFKNMLGNDFKMPNAFPGLLRLKKSHRKKDMATVSQLCRQSLLLAEPGKATAPSTAKSCPSSPELKTKESGKPGWFHRNIFRQK